MLRNCLLQWDSMCYCGQGPGLILGHHKNISSGNCFECCVILASQLFPDWRKLAGGAALDQAHCRGPGELRGVGQHALGPRDHNEEQQPLSWIECRWIRACSRAENPGSPLSVRWCPSATSQARREGTVWEVQKAAARIMSKMLHPQSKELNLNVRSKPQHSVQQGSQKSK